jgi:hypothetical protein
MVMINVTNVTFGYNCHNSLHSGTGMFRMGIETI